MGAQEGKVAVSVTLDEPVSGVSGEHHEPWRVTVSDGDNVYQVCRGCSCSRDRR